MSQEYARVERRAGQRFSFQMPVSLCRAGGSAVGYGVTHDLSARGVFFDTDLNLAEGDPIELTLVMPAEITLCESMRVRCRGKVVRISPSVVPDKFGVAIRLEGYEFLPEVAEIPSAVGDSAGRTWARQTHA